MALLLLLQTLFQRLHQLFKPAQGLDLGLAAELLLRRALGRSVEFSFSGVPVPHLDPYDIVWARRRQVGVDESFFLSSYDIPLAVTDAAGGALGRHLSNADAATTERIESLLGTDTSVT